MRISRRQFACGVAGVTALGAAASQPAVVVDRRIAERRIYALGSVLPPRELLERYGIHPLSVKQQKNGAAYAISFASVEARVKAWDRFNADPDWCALRDRGPVALREVQVYPAGKIFEISL
jgi:hypothetical protein